MRTHGKLLSNDPWVLPAWCHVSAKCTSHILGGGLWWWMDAHKNHILWILQGQGRLLSSFLSYRASDMRRSHWIWKLGKEWESRSRSAPGNSHESLRKSHRLRGHVREETPYVLAAEKGTSWAEWRIWRARRMGLPIFICRTLLNV